MSELFSPGTGGEEGEFLSPRRKQLQDSEFDFLNFSRIKLKEKQQAVSEETIKSAKSVIEIQELRKKYFYKPNPVDKVDNTTKYVVNMVDGVFQVHKADSVFIGKPTFKAPYPYKEFRDDRYKLVKLLQDGAIKTYCHKRLEILKGLFEFHQLLNHELESTGTTNDAKDFYNIVKVDNHVHLAAAMTGRHLLEFMLKKLKDSPDDKVLKDKTGTFLTLKEVLEQAHPEPKDLTTDFLDCHADRSLFHRFDKFNAKYNPCGIGQLRDIFLKSSNDINGKYFGELTKQILQKNEKAKYIYTEYRVSIYGRSLKEWDELARWYLDYKLSSPSNKWIVQIPRVYDYLRKSGKTNNFEEYLTTVFLPLFEVTLDPKSHPDLAEFLKDVVAIDSCDDESVYEESPPPTLPKDWIDGNPCYAYYMYFNYANLYSLNLLRESKGLHPLVYRPHAGEAGNKFHLADCFLVAQSVNHGIELRNSPSLQYLYYLEKIGCSVSPLSNNALFLKYGENPFIDFFKRGLNVTLSTDDPLQFHSTEQPLIEEYSAASQIWKLSNTDMSEIAKNSVLQCSFSDDQKREWLGDDFDRGINDVNKSNIPDIRQFFRDETYDNEVDMLKFYANYVKK